MGPWKDDNGDTWVQCVICAEVLEKDNMEPASDSKLVWDVCKNCAAEEKRMGVTNW